MPGHSGNPKGRPKGARHKTTLAVEALLEGEAEALTRKAIELALEGDAVALRLCLERIAPARKDGTVRFSLPTVETPSDMVAASAAVLEAVAGGNITPNEAQTIATLLQAHGRVLELADLDERLRKLEEERGK
jgi:hypothetical protein